MKTPKLFGTDGVRGKAGEVISPILAIKLAMAAGIYFKRNAKSNKIILGKDTRISGYMIENALVSGFTAVGFDVIQIGPMPTPAIAFLTANMRCDAGIMLSASHNPFYDNGIKFFNHFGFKLDESEEAEIEKIFYNDEELERHIVTDQAIGRSKRIDDVIGRYIVQLKNSFPIEYNLQGMRIVIDAANGAAYKVAPTVLQELGAEVIVLSAAPNGTNINENCGALHPENVCEAVVKYRADIGIALDGDADRLVVVDEKGQVVEGDKLIGALATFLKSEGELKGDAVVATVMSNKALEEYLGKNGIKLLRSNVGDKYVLELMRENKLNFGGEQSGHVILLNYAKTGDGLASALKVLLMLVKTGKKASAVLNPFALSPQLLENIKVVKKLPLEEIVGLSERLSALEAKNIRHLIRYSGTENKLRVLLEGAKKQSLAHEMEELLVFLKEKLS